MTTFHYGIHVHSETPITGVVSASLVAQAMVDDTDAIDLDFEEHQKECKKCRKGKDCEIADMWEGSTTLLHGDWIKDTQGDYMHRTNGEKGYAAIENIDSNTVQVVFSTVTKRCALCSPCYPGQGDLDTPGDYLAYDLPKDFYDEL